MTNENDKKSEIEYLRAAWDKGIKSGRGKYRSIEEVIEAAKVGVIKPQIK